MSFSTYIGILTLKTRFYGEKKIHTPRFGPFGPEIHDFAESSAEKISRTKTSIDFIFWHNVCIIKLQMHCYYGVIWVQIADSASKIWFWTILGMPGQDFWRPVSLISFILTLHLHIIIIKIWWKNEVFSFNGFREILRRVKNHKSHLKVFVQEFYSSHYTRSTETSNNNIYVNTNDNIQVLGYFFIINNSYHIPSPPPLLPAPCYMKFHTRFT